jgi:phosphatidate cytidylyltransferase
MLNTKDLFKRSLFALWAVPAGWWVINSTLSLLPRPAGIFLPGQAAIFLLIGMACYEYITMLSVAFPKNGFWLSYIWIFPLLGLEAFFHFDVPLKYAIFVLLILVALETIVLGEKNTGKWKRASLLFIGMVFLYIAGTSMLNLYEYPFQSYFKHLSHPAMLSQLGVSTVILSVFLCDTGAYFVGSFIGKHRFSTISPNKTIEGSVGGFVIACAACLICWKYWGNHSFSWLVGIGMSIVIGIAAQIGDLMISLIKRNFKVKNASELIPGHGGILDRFGSVFFTAPALGLFFWLAGKFTS